MAHLDKNTDNCILRIRLKIFSNIMPRKKRERDFLTIMQNRNHEHQKLSFVREISIKRKLTRNVFERKLINKRKTLFIQT